MIIKSNNQNTSKTTTFTLSLFFIIFLFICLCKDFMWFLLFYLISAINFLFHPFISSIDLLNFFLLYLFYIVVFFFYYFGLLY